LNQEETFDTAIPRYCAEDSLQNCKKWL